MHKSFKKVAPRGFTLIEILIVIGIIAILAAIVLVAINPARQFRQASNTQRESNVNAILNAIGQYTVDNKGVLPTDISTSVQDIGSGGADICSDISPKYIPLLPTDPDSTNKGASIACSGTYTTGYSVVKDPNGRITVSAPSTKDVDTGNTAAASSTISVTR
jgi:type IV pilus assembly protein PilA